MATIPSSRLSGPGPTTMSDDSTADDETLSVAVSREFLVVWHMGGLEYLLDLTETQQQQILSILRSDSEDSSGSHRNPIQYFLLRAQFNTHRRYEIYRFESELSYNEIEACFSQDPQMIADAIRRVGVCLYSDRNSSVKQVIT